MNIFNPNTLANARPCAAFAAVAALTVLTMAGCASTGGDQPREQMAVARAAVDRAAGPAGADAPVEVSQAREKLERATAAGARKDYDVARRLAEQADADANLV